MNSLKTHESIGAMIDQRTDLFIFDKLFTF